MQSHNDHFVANLASSTYCLLLNYSEGSSTRHCIILSTGIPSYVFLKPKVTLTVTIASWFHLDTSKLNSLSCNATKCLFSVHISIPSHLKLCFQFAWIRSQGIFPSVDTFKFLWVKGLVYWNSSVKKWSLGLKSGFGSLPLLSFG